MKELHDHRFLHFRAATFRTKFRSTDMLRRESLICQVGKPHSADLANTGLRRLPQRSMVGPYRGLEWNREGVDSHRNTGLKIHLNRGGDAGYNLFSGNVLR